MKTPHISLAAEKIGSFFGLPISNSILMTWLVMIILTAFAYFTSRKITLIPSNIQSVAEVVLEGIYDLFKSVVGETYIVRFFPLLATIFLFVIVNNWAGLLPGVGTIGLEEPVSNDAHASIIQTARAADNNTFTETQAEFASPAEAKVVESETGNTKFVPLFRGATADLNTTFAIALVAVFSIQYFGFATLGLSYGKKFINLSSPIMFFVGILEIMSEFSRIISFAFRLFGNIFAGEVLLTVIAFIMPLIAPLPFLGLELFVGFIQALVFSMLTAVFLNVAVATHEH